MEDSIARMRQMTIYSNIIMHPEGSYVKQPDVGSRPNYNVAFNEKRTFAMSPKKDK